MRDTRRIYDVPSRGTVQIPGEDLLDQHGELVIDPLVLSKGYFSIHYAGRVLQLVAGGFCGMIPINSKAAINVRPKMPLECLSRVLEVASLSVKRITGVRRSFSIGSNNVPLFEFTANEFQAVLQQLIDDGLRKSYRSFDTNSGEPRGRLLLGKHIEVNLSRGRTDRVYSQHFSLVQDIAENRILELAARKLIEQARAYGLANRLVRDLSQSLLHLSGLSRATTADLDKVRRLTVNPNFMGPYAIALRLAIVIIAGDVLDLPYRPSGIDLSAAVINFDEFFEAYIQNTLISHQPTLGPNRRVLDGNTSGKKGLFDGRRDPAAKPDVVITSIDRKPLIVVEVKYKDWPERSDVNQAITYAVTYRVRKVVLVHQSTSAETSGLQSMGSLDEIELMRYGLPLGSNPLEPHEAHFAKSIFDLANAISSD